MGTSYLAYQAAIAFVFQDNFNRSDGVLNTGVNYYDMGDPNGIVVNANSAKHDIGSSVYATVSTSVHTFSPDQYAQMTVVLLSGNVQILRLRSPWVRAEWSQFIALRIYTPTMFNTGITVSATDTIKIAVVGGAITAYKNGSVVYTGAADDPTETGQPSFGFNYQSGSLANTKIDNFEAGEILS